MDPEAPAIRAVIERWLAATRAGDVDGVLALMCEDVLFLQPGAAPLDKDGFARQARAQAGLRFELRRRVLEVQVLGDHAYARTHLTVTLTPPDGRRIARAGQTLSIFRREGGQWRLARDANLLAPVEAA